MPALRKIAVHVMHEDPLVSAGLSTVLGRLADVAVTIREAAASSVGWVDLIADVVISDYRSGMAYLADVGDRVSDPRGKNRLLVVTTLDREWEVRSAMNAGAHGYLLQSCRLEELIAGVRMVDRGSRYLCNQVTCSIADSLTREPLTSRESEVLKLLTYGMCNKTIAKELGIAVGTVKAHVKSIFEKLNARTRTHAVILATQRGLVQDPPPSVAITGSKKEQPGHLDSVAGQMAYA